MAEKRRKRPQIAAQRTEVENRLDEFMIETVLPDWVDRAGFRDLVRGPVVKAWQDGFDAGRKAASPTPDSEPETSDPP